MGYDGLPDRFDSDTKQPCVAEWRENAKCKDWTTNLDDCCCDAEITLPPPEPIIPRTDQEFIRLKFKLAINFDTFAPQHNKNASAGRYKIKEITDEQAYEAGILGKMLASFSSSRSVSKMTAGGDEEVNGDDMEKALNAYYGELDCLFPEIGYTWEDKKKDYGDVFLICKEIWWGEDQGLGVGEQHVATDNDACFTQRGLYTETNTYGNKELFEKGERLNAFNHHGPHPVPACYGLPEFKGTPFEDPIWQRDEPNNQCNPPHKNEYIKDENEEDTDKLGRTYQIFWKGGNADNEGWADLNPDNIKDGQGDNPKPLGVFWNGIPNELYRLTVQHDLYQFPDFYRTDEVDGNGNNLGNVIKGAPEFRDADGNIIYHNDIRDVFFADLPPLTNLPVDGQTPYVAGCDCADRNDDNINNDPYADINLNYLDGIKANSTETKHIDINSSEVESLMFCNPLDHYKTIEFDPILPTTIFESIENYEEWIKNPSEGGKLWVDYIKEGQYSVFHVTLAPKGDPDHPNTDPNVGCHDQVSYHFAFALNLKDTLQEEGTYEPDPKCYTGAGLGSIPLSKLPKLYYPAREATGEVTYPGELYVKNNSEELDYPPQKQCIFLNGALGGSQSKYKGSFAPVERLETPAGYSWGIGKDEDGHLLLHPDQTFGVHTPGPDGAGLTLLAEVLESRPTDSGYIDEETGKAILDLHLHLGIIASHNSIAGEVRAGHAWSHFGPNNPDK